VPYAEALLTLLLRLWRVTLLFVVAWILLLVWLAVRRAGRRGLEIALPMWATAAVLFLVAVFAPRPALTDTVAAGLVIVSAALVVGSVVALLLAGRRPSRLGRHRGPPWEGEGW
jgi:uncharacterized membrane protein YoaK (UPF0700 family)